MHLMATVVVVLLQQNADLVHQIERLQQQLAAKSDETQEMLRKHQQTVVIKLFSMHAHNSQVIKGTGANYREEKSILRIVCLKFALC